VLGLEPVDRLPDPRVVARKLEHRREHHRVLDREMFVDEAAHAGTEPVQRTGPLLDRESLRCPGRGAEVWPVLSHRCHRPMQQREVTPDGGACAVIVVSFRNRAGR
jgi:hypothetical protein